MSLSVTLTAVGTTDTATSADMLSTGDGTTPTTHATGELADATDATYAYMLGGFTAEWAAGEYSDLPATLAVHRVTLTTRQRRGVGSDPAETQTVRAVVRIGGTNYYGDAETCADDYTNHTHAFVLNPSTNEAWTRVAVKDARFGVEVTSDAVGAPPLGPEANRLIVTVDYDPLPAGVDMVRDMVSREHFLRAPESFADYTGNLDTLLPVLDGGFMPVVQLAHIAGPNVGDAGDEQGWGAEGWQTRPMQLHAVSIDQTANLVTSRLKDLRDLACTLRYLAYSDLASGSLGNGISRYALAGSVWHFERTTSATFTNPPGQSETVPINTPAYAAGGLEIFAAAGARGADDCWVEFDADCVIWGAAATGFQAEVRLASIGAGFQTVCYLSYDANHSLAIHWSAGQWSFAVVVGGVYYAATFAATPTVNVWYQIGARMTGPNGENGDAPYTLSIFVDRVKGTDSVTSGPLVIPATGPWNLAFGSSPGLFGGSYLGGQIRKIHVYSQAPTDTEMMRPL